MGISEEGLEGFTGRPGPGNLFRYVRPVEALFFMFFWGLLGAMSPWSKVWVEMSWGLVQAPSASS